MLAAADLADSGTASDVGFIMSAIGDGDVFLDDIYAVAGDSALTVSSIRSCIEYVESAKSHIRKANSAYIRTTVVEFLSEASACGKSLTEIIGGKLRCHRSLSNSVYVIPKVRISYNERSSTSFPNMIIGYSKFYELAGEYKESHSRKGVSDPAIENLLDEIDSGIDAMSGCPLIKAATSGEYSDLLRLIVGGSFNPGAEDPIDDYYERNGSSEDAGEFISRFANEIADAYYSESLVFGDGSPFEMRGEYLSVLAKSLKAKTSGGIDPDDLIYDVMEYDILRRLIETSGGAIDAADLESVRVSLISKISDLAAAHEYVAGLIDFVISEDGRFRRGF